MYLLKCSDGSCHTGSTKNLDLRLEQHQAGEGNIHSKKSLPVKLIYFEEFPRVDKAQVIIFYSASIKMMIFGRFNLNKLFIGGKRKKKILFL